MLQRKKNVFLSALCAVAFLSIGLASLAARANPSFWRYFSDEDWNNTSKGECGGQYAMGGFTCSGRYCDNNAVGCQALPSNVAIGAPAPWTSTFSEEGLNTSYCPWGSVITGMKCRGDYCDNMSLQCSPVTMGGYDDCHWEVNSDGTYKTWSEENGGNWLFGNNRFATGAFCTGRYCDNLGFYTCGLVP